METEPGQKQITAILRYGMGHKILDLLFENGIHSGDLHRARGVGITPLLGSKALGTTIEWEILNVLVPESQADHWFQLIFDQGDIDRPHGGFIYMHDIDLSSVFRLPELADQEKETP